MKGIILAGGNGTRLAPMTRVTNKHLLPVYDKPMIMYPLQTLLAGGITDILIVSGKGHAGHFLELLGNGKTLGARISYAVQEEAGGIAQALALAEDFADEGPVTVILGDNIYEDTFRFDDFTAGARIYLKEVDDAKRFGVATLVGDAVTEIIEKPEDPKSKHAVTGLYVYDATVFAKIKTLEPSDRGELEITDVNNMYVADGQLEAGIVTGFWSDAGTVESLYKAATLARSKYAG